MDRRLLDYLPPVLRDVLEFQAINEANEPEISLAWDAMALILANQFLETADAVGVGVWEKELRIFPKDTDTLEMRKARIKALWNLELPYTTPWLRNWLTSLCGPDGHEETIFEYTIHIQLDYTVLPDAEKLAAEILDMLLTVRPANMRVMLSAFMQSYGGIQLGALTETANDCDIWPYVVNEIESFGKSVMTGALEYSSRFEIYPVEQEEKLYGE